MIDTDKSVDSCIDERDDFLLCLCLDFFPSSEKKKK